MPCLHVLIFVVLLLPMRISEDELTKPHQADHNAHTQLLVELPPVSLSGRVESFILKYYARLVTISVTRCIGYFGRDIVRDTKIAGGSIGSRAGDIS